MQNDSYEPYPEQQAAAEPAVPPVWQNQTSTLPPRPLPVRPHFATEQPQIQPSPAPRAASKLPKIMELLGIVVLVLMALVGGYLLRDQTGKRGVTSVQQSAKSTVHTVTAVGYPAGTTDVVTTKLGIASDEQAIEQPTNASNPGIVSQFSNTTNDEMGRWVIGNPTDVVGGTIGDITMVNLVRQTYYDIPVPKSFQPSKQSPGYELQIANTPYAKSSALKSYIARITECSSDSSMGTVISDFMNICVTPEVLTSTAKDSFHSEAVIEGYGKSGDVELLLLGTISLETSHDLTPARQKQISTEYTAAVQKASNDSGTPALPDYAIKRADAIRSALASTTVTITNTAK